MMRHPVFATSSPAPLSAPILRGTIEASLREVKERAAPRRPGSRQDRAAPEPTRLIGISEGNEGYVEL
jgi:hypothetical protein